MLMRLSVCSTSTASCRCQSLHPISRAYAGRTRFNLLPQAAPPHAATCHVPLQRLHAVEEPKHDRLHVQGRHRKAGEQAR